jgi:iron complex outermembrane recepter protein
MRYLIILFLALNNFIVAQNREITGFVFDSDSKKPLPKANIVMEGKAGSGASTLSDGKFTLSGVDEGDILIISYVGYYQNKYQITNDDFDKQLRIYLDSRIIPSQTVLVEASLGKEGFTPLTFDKIKRAEIENSYTVQDIPVFLSSLPSTTFYSESGNGIGYNYLSIRGFDQRRISVSINGIPQNDPEDHNVYWLDFPDLLASTELIQVQRGAGSSVLGYPAIGGSINIITSTFSNQPKMDLSASYGSYHTRKYSASFSSGLIDEKYSVYAKLSQILSSGYRHKSWVKFNAYHLSAVRYDNKLTTQINLFGGPIEDGLAYTGLPKFAIKDRELRRDNYSYWEADENTYTYTVDRRPEEVENFSQPHYELLNEYRINDNITLNSALFLVLGNGFFDYDGSWADTSYFRLTADNGFNATQNPGNVLIRAQVENTQYGWIPRVSFKHTNGEFIAGLELRKHSSVHWGSLIYGENLPAGITKDYRYYYYEGGKDIINGFIHESYRLSDKINLLGEVQIAYHNYKLNNEKYVGTDFTISNLFINPRAGINYRVNPGTNVYISFARVSREPRLKNYYDAAESSGGTEPQFEAVTDNSGNVLSYNFDNPLVNHETMNNIELGALYNKDNFTAGVNFFYMLFNDEIVRSGQVDRFGQPVTGNVDRTIHRGIEVSLLAKLFTGLELFANATYSNNIIDEGSAFVRYRDPVTNDRLVGRADLSGNRIAGFPDFLANFGISYSGMGLHLRLTGRYVGDFRSDNYDDKLSEYLNTFPRFVSYVDNLNEAYFTADFSGSYSITLFGARTPSKIFIQINNIFDNLYSANAIGSEFFPAAERNFLAGLQIGL